MTLRWPGLLLLVVALLGAACGGGEDAAESVTEQPTGAAAPAAATMLSAKMTGAEEAPGPGARKGRGSVSVDLSQPGKVCFQMKVKRLKGVNAAHIHRAPVGQPGDAVVDLKPPKKGSSKGCPAVDQALIDEIAANPTGFYVNVHTKKLPDGAIRGQLAPAG